MMSTARQHRFTAPDPLSDRSQAERGGTERGATERGNAGRTHLQAVSATAPRQAVMVLGMHRSGTSAVTRALNFFGASLPVRLLDSLPDNPKGFFEPVEIVSLHDRMLEAAGSSWRDFDRLPSSAWREGCGGSSCLTELVDAIRHDFADEPLFVVKDPRICRFFPLWREALSAAGASPVVVLPYRNPIEVAESLRARNGLSLAHGFLLWLRHVLDAEHDTRGEPRAFLRYEDLATESRPTLQRLLDSIPIRWPRAHDAFAAVEEFVEAKLRHNVADLHEVRSRDDVPDWVKGSYEAYERLRLDPGDSEAWARLDQIRTEFDAIAPTFSTAFKHVDAERLSAERRASRADALDREVHDLRGRLHRVEPIAARTFLLSQDLSAAKEATAAEQARSEALARQLETGAREADARAAANRATLALAEQRIARRGARLELLRRADRRPIARVRAWISRLRRPRRLRRALDITSASGLFDPDWYLDANPDVEDAGFDPLLHYVMLGEQEGRRPGLGFDPAWYLSAYPDVAASGFSPLAHFLKVGLAENRLPLRPAPTGVASADSVR